VQAFCEAARGGAAIPWQRDFDAEERRLLLPMIGQGELARRLARALRAAMQAQQAIALAQRARGLSPLDLHRLLPVPDDILMLGPDDPASRAWLWANWGTLCPLRHVTMEQHSDKRALRRLQVRFRFYAAEWSPWQALLRLRESWPMLRLALQPRYGDGAPANAGVDDAIPGALLPAGRAGQGKTARAAKAGVPLRNRGRDG
jgi:hypothetical protein